MLYSVAKLPLAHHVHKCTCTKSYIQQFNCLLKMHHSLIYKPETTSDTLGAYIFDDVTIFWANSQFISIIKRRLEDINFIFFR